MQQETENSLKSGCYWMNAIAVVMVIAALPFLFTPQGIFPDHRLIPHLLNASHIPFFFLFTWVGISIVGSWRRAGFGVSLTVANLVVLLVGIGVESIQLWEGRQASFSDLARNSIGASLAVTLHSRTSSTSRAIKYTVFSGLIAVTLVAFIPLFKNAIDWVNARNRFPILADFETPFQRERWLDGQIVRLAENNENYVLGHRFSTARYSTLSLEHFDGNWRGYHCFRFRIFNPQDTSVQLTLRINDREHNLTDQRYDDRFNSSIVVAPGWVRYSIDLESVKAAPRGRSMDITKIERILFFSSSLKEPVSLYFDDLVLGTTRDLCAAQANQPAQ